MALHCMDESFQLFRIIPKFRILWLTFHRKILNELDHNSFSDLNSFYLKTIDHLNLTF